MWASFEYWHRSHGIFSTSDPQCSSDWTQDLHTMYLLYGKKSNEIRPLPLLSSSPSASSNSGSITVLLLKSFPDNRWCFLGLVPRADPGAEQRALEEQSVDLHRGAVTSKHELNSNQPSGNTHVHMGLHVCVCVCACVCGSPEE